ncbi:MAG: hypothetical protein JKX82_09705 [Oleispira sp.]|nr:hypothetical protein [Oleispira sp.]
MKFTKLDDKELLDVVKPLAEHTENSWNQKSYEGFCRFLYEGNPDGRLSEEEFNHQLEESYDTFGIHTIAELVVIHRNPENVIVIWKVDFEKRKELGLLMYRFIEHEGKALIDGCTYHA